MNPDRQQIFGHVSLRLNPPLSPLNLRGDEGEADLLFFCQQKNPAFCAGFLFFEARFARKLLLSGFLIIACKDFYRSVY
jgi:hypothetical protein